MCVQYWPANLGTFDEYFGIKVELLKEEELANFQMRTLKVTKAGEVRLFFVVVPSIIVNDRDSALSEHAVDSILKISDLSINCSPQQCVNLS